MEKELLYRIIEETAPQITDLSDRIWSYAELSMLEHRSTAAYVEVLKDEGFTVQENLCGIATAFSGSFGSGRPVIGLLGAVSGPRSGSSPAPGSRRLRTRLRAQSAGCGCFVRCHCHQAGHCRRTAPRHGGILRLPRRGGLRRKDLHGQRRNVPGSGCRSDLAPRRHQRGHRRLQRRQHSDGVFLLRHCRPRRR